MKGPVIPAVFIHYPPIRTHSHTPTAMTRLLVRITSLTLKPCKIDLAKLQIARCYDNGNTMSYT